MAEDFYFLFWFASGLVVGWCCHSIRHGRASLNAQLDEMPSTRWRALPGDVLTLGDTGFEIRLEPGLHKGHPFVLYSPEGVAESVAVSGWLSTLQLKAEAMARERDAFKERA